MNIPLVEALEHISSYVRFLKDILIKKQWSGQFETLCLTMDCSTILTSKILYKTKDPGSFAILVAIRGQKIKRALYDLGASINLMLLSVYKKLRNGRSKAYHYDTSTGGSLHSQIRKN